MGQPIPFTIHQTWCTHEVPEKWRAFQRSWRLQHPDWRYRLWSDIDLRQLIVRHYPWFLAIYDNYSTTIQRVDAARYFLLHRHGGIYADLDYECLRPFDHLTTTDEVVLGLEPREHLAKDVVRRRGLDKVVGNALLVSPPSHPFWEHVFRELVGAHRIPGPLASTGPFLLSRALQNYSGRRLVRCLPPELLYPGTSDEGGSGKAATDERWRERIRQTAYGIHHWSGSWIKDAATAEARATLAMTVVEHGRSLFEANLNANFANSNDTLAGDTAPLVSCLMVTRSQRLGFATRAIACFQAQTYPAKELVVVDDGEGDELPRYLEGLADHRIRLVKLPAAGQTLGALRNLAVAAASGEFIVQWDDDDLYHPRRIEVQRSALAAAGGDACLLSRWKMWWPATRRIAVSKKRGWEGSLLCRKNKLPAYDETKRRGEDTPVVLRLASREKVVFLDAPWLYTYVVHGENTTSSSDLERHWAQASEFHWGTGYGDALRALAEPLPEQVGGELRREAERLPEPAQPLSPIEMGEDWPEVLVLSPVKDGRPYLESYFSALKQLAYPQKKLSLALLESDSRDGTHEALASCLKTQERRFARVELFKRDYGFRFSGPRFNPQAQFQRQSILARSRNYLLSRALREEKRVLWLDFDVIEYPADALLRLLRHGKDVIVPHCVLAPGGRTFDLNTFIETAPPDDGVALLQPARGHGRKYLEDARGRELIEVDGVGGTMLLVNAELHREGLIFPTAPYRQRLETEGLACLARDMGSTCWALPDLEVIHANH